MHRGLHRSADIGVDGGVDAALQELPALAGSDKDIALVVVAEPLILVRGGCAMGERPDKTEMEMRLPGDIADNAGDGTEHVVIQFERLADHVRGIYAAEISLSGGLVDDQ